MNIRFVTGLLFGILFGFLFMTGLAIAGPIPNPIEQAHQQMKDGDVNGAIATLTPLANRGDPTASWILVRVYIYARSSYQNVEKGIEILERLSSENDPNSKEALGDLYYYGKLVPQDYKKAAEWYADYVKYERDPDILTRYALLFAMGKGVEQDKNMAFRLLNEAVRKGYIPAFLLGRKVYQSLDPFERFFIQ